MIEVLGLSGWELVCKFDAFYDKIAMKIAWILPKRVVRFAYVRVIAYATSGQYGTTHPDDVTYNMGYNRWEKKPHSKKSISQDNTIMRVVSTPVEFVNLKVVSDE